MGRRILVVSYFVNEDGMACAHHIDDRLAVLEQEAETVLVLSSWCVPAGGRGVHVRVASLSPSGLRFEIRRRFHRLIRRGKGWKIVRDFLLLPLVPLYGLERTVSRIDPTWHWQPLAVRAGLRLCRDQQLDTVYSTGGPPVAHSVGRAIAARLPVKWLAEVQDPLIHGYCAGHRDEREKLVQVERQIYQDADRMIFLTHGAKRATEQRLGLSGKGAVIYPGAPPVRLPASPDKGDMLRLAHFGSLGGVRNLGPLIAALELILDQDPAMERELRIELYGNVGADDQQRIKGSRSGRLFRLHGLVSRERAMQAMAACDVLLLIQGVHDISRETIPSKCYEYLLCGRPIFALVHENGELTAMLTRLGHLPVAAADAEEIVRGLESLVRDWRQDALPRPEPSPYTVQQAVHQLLEL